MAPGTQWSQKPRQLPGGVSAPNERSCEHCRRCSCRRGHEPATGECSSLHLRFLPFCQDGEPNLGRNRKRDIQRLAFLPAAALTSSACTRHAFASKSIRGNAPTSATAGHPREPNVCPMWAQPREEVLLSNRCRLCRIDRCIDRRALDPVQDCPTRSESCGPSAAQAPHV